jgi:hypothetical protein
VGWIQLGCKRHQSEVSVNMQYVLGLYIDNGYVHSSLMDCNSNCFNLNKKLKDSISGSPSCATRSAE